MPGAGRLAGLRQRQDQRAGVELNFDTPLLLLSATKGHPNGLAKSSGLAGKWLMTHPLQAVTGYFDDDLLGWQGAWGKQLESTEFYETDAGRGFVRGAKWGCSRPAG